MGSTNLLWRTASLLFLVVPAAGSIALADAPVRLTDEGKPSAVIVLPGGAAAQRADREAAALLAGHIRQMSGADLLIIEETELQGRLANGRVVSTTNRLPVGVESFVLIGQTELAQAMRIDTEGLGVGGIRLKTRGNALVLMGGPTSAPGHEDPNGIRHAVIELLEELGCRYLWPGETGKVVPRRATVEVGPLDISYTPVVGARGMRWGRMRERGETGLRALGISVDEWRRSHERALSSRIGPSWMDWQRLGGRMPRFGHAGGGLRDADRYLTERPEWFALQADGGRDQGGDSRFRLCKSNPQLIRHVASDIIRRVNANPDTALVSLDPNDGGSNTGWCLCENCRALDPPHGPRINLLTFGARTRPDRPARRRERVPYVSLTDRMIFYWNSIADIVTSEHPDLLFGVSAYSVFSHPPVERRLHPNLVLRYVPEDRDRWEGWRQAGARRIFWRPNILLINRRHGKLCSIVGRLADNMRYFAGAGMTQTDFDHINHNWATLGLSYYATARLTWNPRLTAGEIIRDYTRSGFGAGAPFVERYFQRVEALTRAGVAATHNSPADYRYNPQAAAGLHELLNRAAAAAGDDADVQERIAFLRLGLNFTELQETLDDMARRATAGEAVDMVRARRLVDLNSLVLRDLLLNHNLAVNVPQVIWGSGTFRRWDSLGGRRVMPSDPALLERLRDERFGLTGREQGIDDMLKAYGMGG